MTNGRKSFEFDTIKSNKMIPTNTNRPVRENKWFFGRPEIKTLSSLQFHCNETFEQFSSENVLNTHGINIFEEKKQIYEKTIHIDS